ncbi:uncharacterized protein LOC110665003 [Hevea brasiliensis]|uniref:uncharacterized protein LOC110665003 n=1 Tax=Hevea brasiliensis TaxID=3981 RepID=UPI0025F057C1|nr:uncharacterized protein LOC110665003 [Hevea brasiliensis]
MDPLLDSPPPESLHSISSLMLVRGQNTEISFLGTFFAAGFFLRDFMDLLLSPASKVLNNWFETDVLKATLATDAVIGTTSYSS